MRMIRRRRQRASAAAAAVMVLAISGCGLQPAPPPQFSQSDFNGTGDKMAACMQFASQSYCEREIWGGNEL